MVSKWHATSERSVLIGASTGIVAFVFVLILCLSAGNHLLGRTAVIWATGSLVVTSAILVPIVHGYQLTFDWEQRTVTVTSKWFKRWITSAPRYPFASLTSATTHHRPDGVPFEKVVFDKSRPLYFNFGWSREAILRRNDLRRALQLGTDAEFQPDQPPSSDDATS